MTYTLHAVEARCPTPGCGAIRVLQIYGPPEKVTMDRLCDTCTPKPLEMPEVKARYMPVASPLPELRRPRRPYADD